MNAVRENRTRETILGTTLVVAVVAACMIVVPVAANLGLLILATDPNPRHPPADLMGEAVGWAIAGVLVGAMVVIITESVVWPGSKGFVAKYKGLILGSAISLVIGACLGLTFAVIQMDSVDGQAITSKSLGVMAGATAGTLGAIAGIIAGTTVRRFVINLYRLPNP